MFVAISVLDAWSLSVLADDEPTKPDPDNPKVVERGKAVYAKQCASCHGANLEGQPDWRHRLPSGRVPAPPHDPSGHTWHHSDKQLFDMTKFGPGALVPGYESDMPGFKDIAQRRRNLGRALIHREHVADRYQSVDEGRIAFEEVETGEPDPSPRPVTMFVLEPKT